MNQMERLLITFFISLSPNLHFDYVLGCILEGTIMRTIMVLNSKGGSGKTTLVTNLAGYYASQGKTTIIKDYDPQGSSSEWIKQRCYSLPQIHGLSAFKSCSPHVTRAWQMRLPANADRLIIDTPAGINLQSYVSTIKSVDKILIPLSPSSIDVRATAMFVHNLQEFMGLYSSEADIAIVANRVNVNSSAYQAMVTTFRNLSLSFVTTLSTNEHYLQAAERGVSLLEIDHPSVAQDKLEWAPLLNWIEEDVVMQTKQESHLYAV